MAKPMRKDDGAHGLPFRFERGIPDVDEVLVPRARSREIRRCEGIIFRSTGSSDEGRFGQVQRPLELDTE